MASQFLTRVRWQSKRIGTRLMALYLLLLLVPVVGVGFYGHLNIREMLADSALRNGLDEVAIRASTIDTLLGQIHADILYLEQRLGVTDLPDATAELDGMAFSHPLYRAIAQVGLDQDVKAGHLTASLQDWMRGTEFASLAEMPPNTIRFFALPPLPGSDETDDARLVAGVRLQADLLLFDISMPYLLQSISSDALDDRWALFVAPGTLLMLSDEVQPAELGLDEMTGSSGSITLGETTSLYHAAGPGGNWTLVHSILNDTIIPDMTRYYILLVFIILGGVIAVGGLALMALSRIITPVYQLEKMVEEVRCGVPRPQLPGSVPRDELGNLMLAFDQMAEELEQKRCTERALIEQLIRAQEEERKLIAYDLHDGLIQSLVGARFYLGQARGCTEQQSDGVAQGYGILTRAIVEGRRIIQGLHPTVLEDLGLEAALTELAKSMMETANWELDINIDALDPEPDRTISVILYRITQEALNNIFKHAVATHVWLALTQADSALHLVIRDNGQGFDPEAIASNGWGIKTMRERASMLKGTCSILSNKTTGTTIRVTIPCQVQKESVTA